MAALKRVYNQRYLILVWSVLEILLFSAIVYGWAALVVVLKQEGFFYDLCETKHKANSTFVVNSGDCIKQDERLNLVFLTGVISFSGSGIVSGAFLDRFGPRKTRLLSSFFFVLTFLFLVLADKDRPYLIFPGIATLSAAGLTLVLTLFQVANMFNKWKSSVISLFNGAVDSSAIVLLFFKLVYDGGIPLRSINICYYLSAIILILLFTFILPPNTITSERLEAINVYGSMNAISSTSHESPAKHEDEDEILVKFEGTQSNGTMKVNDASETNEKVKTRKDGKLRQETDFQLSPLCQSEAIEDNDDEVDNTKDSAPRLVSQMLSAEYILLSLFLSISNLRLWFYVGSLNSYLEFMSGNDMDTVSHYTNWFGIIQFAGFFFAPVVGFVMDWKPKKKRNEKTDIGFVFGFLLTSFVGLVLNILVLVPSLPVQYASFVVQVVLRAFVYSVYAAFILHKFPLVHFGRLFGAGHIISSVIGSTQYGLFIIAEDTLEKDPFWVNVGLLVLCVFLNVLPAYLWFKEKRQDRQKKRSGVKRIVIR